MLLHIFTFARLPFFIIWYLSLDIHSKKLSKTWLDKYTYYVVCEECGTYNDAEVYDFLKNFRLVQTLAFCRPFWANIETEIQCEIVNIMLIFSNKFSNIMCLNTSSFHASWKHKYLTTKLTAQKMTVHFSLFNSEQKWKIYLYKSVCLDGSTTKKRTTETKKKSKHRTISTHSGPCTHKQEQFSLFVRPSVRYQVICLSLFLFLVFLSLSLIYIWI